MKARPGVEGTSEVGAVRARRMQGTHRIADGRGGCGFDPPLEQLLLPHRVIVRRQEFHRQQAGPLVARQRGRHRVRHHAGGKAQPGPLVRVARHRCLPIDCHLQLGQGPLDAQAAPVAQIHAPDVGRDAAGQRRPLPPEVRSDETRAGEEVVELVHRDLRPVRIATPAYGAPHASSIRSSWLYLETVLEVRSDPILI